VGCGSGDARFSDLAWALQMLDEGEAPPLLRPSKPRGGRGGRGAPAQITAHRMRAILGAVYLHYVGSFKSITAARKKIAELYGVTGEVMEKWPAAIKRVIGAKQLEQDIAFAGITGMAAVRLKERWPEEAQRARESGERTYGLASLKADGERFQILQKLMRKRSARVGHAHS
jgi:hypothetical protein